MNEQSSMHTIVRSCYLNNAVVQYLGYLVYGSILEPVETSTEPRCLVWAIINNSPRVTLILTFYFEYILGYY